MAIWGATISRLLEIIGLFCRISSLLYGSFAKETYDFQEPTNRSHPIAEAPAQTPHIHFGLASFTRDMTHLPVR